MQSDKRKSERYIFTHPITYTFNVAGAKSDNKGIILNICKDGAGIITPFQLVEGSELLLENNLTALPLPAEVRWVKHVNQVFLRAGLEFKPDTPTKKTQINSLVRSVKNFSALIASGNRNLQMEQVISECLDKCISEAERESQERIRGLIDAAPYGAHMYELQKDGRLIFIGANQAAERILGVDHCNFVGKTIEEAFPALATSDVPDIYKHIARTGGVHDFEHIAYDGHGISGTYEVHVCQTAENKISAFFRDITERKKAEEALQLNERKYREIFNATSDALSIHDKNSNVLDVNEQTLVMFRCDRETALRLPLENFSLGEPPYSQAEAAEKVRKAFHEGPQVFEWMSRRYDGELFWSEVALRASDIAGRRQVIASVRDISDRKLAEESLKKREDELRSLFRAAPIGIAVVVNRVIKTANERLCEMTGYSLEELLNKDARMLYPTDDDYEYVGKEKYRQIAGKGTGMVETRWLRKDGSVIHILLSSAQIDPSDLSKGVTATALDISDRKLAEEALLKAHAKLEQRVEERTAELRESEEKFRTLAETSLAGIFIYQGEKFLYVNPMIETITGYSREELLQMRFWDFMHPDFKDLIRERGFARQRGEPVPAQYELKIINKEGDERWIAVYGAAFQFAGKRSALGTAFDITERKQAEEKILMYQDQLRSLAAELTLAEECERRKISTTLHDQVIQMLALCKIKIEEFKEIHTEGAMKQIDEISGLLEQAIHSSRSLISELSPQILYTLGFEAAVEWLGEKLLEKNSIKFQFQDDGQPKPLKDDTRIILFLSVRELMFNIVKHSKANEAKVQIQKIDKSIQIVVEDNGAGFDTSQTITPDGHRGFGLFNIREQLYSIGGQLKIEFGQGKGTRITILVPITLQEDAGIK
jgi:PAS domain S-box-containing protein